MKTFTTFYRRVIVVVRSIDDTLPDIDLRLPIVIAPLTEGDLPAYLHLRPDQHSNTIRKRLAKGDQCFAVWHEGQIVHTGWVTTEQKYEPYLRRKLTLQPADIFLYDNYTHPSLRRFGLAQARTIYLLRHYQAEGYRRSVAIIAVENKAALRQIEAAGYHRIGMFKCIRFGPWQWNWEERWGEEPLPGSTK